MEHINRCAERHTVLECMCVASLCWSFNVVRKIRDSIMNCSVTVHHTHAHNLIINQFARTEGNYIANRIVK